jgi:hypothetical protein
MSQRNVELFIGRLLTDEDLRRQFVRKPERAISDFCRQGWELSEGEIDALVASDSAMWEEVASRVPSRLQRCSLKIY